MKIRITARICVLSLSVLFLGCSLPARIGIIKEEFSPLPEDLPAPLSPEEMLLVLNDRAPEINTLWAELKVRIKGKTKEESGFFIGTFLYAPPERARLRGYRTGTPTLFEILAVEHNLFFHLNREKELYLGSIEEWNASPVIFSDVDIRDVGLVLEPLQVFRTALKEGTYRLTNTTRQYYMFEVSELPGGRLFSGKLEFIVRKKDLLVREMLVHDTSGKERGSVVYETYDIFNGIYTMPTKVLLNLDRHNTRILLYNINYKINQPFSEKVFSPPEYRGIELLPLRDLWEKSKNQEDR